MAIVTNDDRKYVDSIVRIKKRYENKFVPIINRAILNQIAPVIDAYKLGGKDYALLAAGIIQPMPVDKALRQLYFTITPYEAEREYRRLKRTKAGLGVPSEDWIAVINEFYRLNVLQKSVQEITDTTKRRLTAILQNAALEGQSIDDIIKAIQDAGITIARARMIARTESNRAVNYGHNIAVKEIGFKVKKKWVSARDRRTRGAEGDYKADHYHMNGQLVEYEQPFIDPRSNAQMDYPGDVELGAQGKDVINCRCVVVHEPVRDADGNLITI